MKDNFAAARFIDKITPEIKEEIDGVVGDLAWQPRGW